jgi:DNA mismatch repair protein MutL
MVVATLVEALVLGRPEVRFSLRSDVRRTPALPAAADLEERIAQVHGLSLARSLIALADPVVWGFVSPLAVNGRVVEADSFAPAGTTHSTKAWPQRPRPDTASSRLRKVRS